MILKQAAAISLVGSAGMLALFSCPSAHAAEHASAPARSQITALAFSPDEIGPSLSTSPGNAFSTATSESALQRETVAHPQALQTLPGDTSLVRIAALDAADAKPAASTPVMATTTAPPQKVDPERISDRFHKALRERGLAVGYGQKLPFSRFDKRTDNTMFQVIPFKGRFRNSTQEILWEAPIVMFTQPDTNFLAGLSLVFRQHLTSNPRFAPYVEFGGGANLTNLDMREIGGRFQVSLQGGAGIRTKLNNKTELTVGARWYHLSNGGLMRPNTGLNDYLFTIGASHLF